MAVIQAFIYACKQAAYSFKYAWKFHRYMKRGGNPDVLPF